MLNTRTTLCPRCKTIDIGKLLSRPSDGPILGQVALYKGRTCVLCNLFLEILPAEAKRDHYVHFHYRLRSMHSHLIDGRLSISQKIVLALFPIPRVMPEILDGPGLPCMFSSFSANGAGSPKLRDCIDLNVPMTWIQRCARKHTETCLTSFDTAGPSKLIDCTTRAIVSASKVDYVTLSYVWGSETQSRERMVSDLSRLPEILPKTIEDTIAVTQKLGYRYLWVDKYCITDSEDFINQVRQMDLIYQNSTLTIIDAAGKNPHEGLPGIRQGSRTPLQSSAQIGDYELISTMSRPEWLIKCSPWSTRGWTYQEGLLSRRRLVFTTEQLYFECQELNCKEVMSLTATDNRVRQDGSYRPDETIYNLDSSGMWNLHLVSGDAWSIYAFLTEYTRRSLSHEDDILNGILGLFRFTEKLEFPMLHLWGLPFQEKSSLDLGPDNDSVHMEDFIPRIQRILFQDNFFIPLSRRVPSFRDSLRWKLITPSTRRKGFPSWSWTGWFGEARWPEDFNQSGNNLLYTETRQVWDFEVKLETHTGETFTFEQYTQRYDALNPSPSFLKPVIRILAYTVLAHRVDPEQDAALFQPNFTLRDPDTGEQVRCTATTTEFLDDSSTYHAVKLADYALERMYAVFQREVLIVKHMGDFWERVAIGHYTVSRRGIYMQSYFSSQEILLG